QSDDADVLRASLELLDVLDAVEAALVDIKSDFEIAGVGRLAEGAADGLVGERKEGHRDRLDGRIVHQVGEFGFDAGDCRGGANVLDRAPGAGSLARMVADGKVEAGFPLKGAGFTGGKR